MNQRNRVPTIKISDNQIYEINTSKEVRRKYNKEMKKIRKVRNLVDVLKIADKIFPILLGEKAAIEIKKMDLSIDNIISILMAIEAALNSQVKAKYR